MAKAKSGVNKSEAIRGAYKELPNAKAKEIVALLKAKGIDVAEGLVYQVKKTTKKKKKLKPGPKPKTSQATAAKKASAAPSSNGRLGVGASIALVKSTAERVGGWEVLKEIVDALQ
jgi:hypothetical protein